MLTKKQLDILGVFHKNMSVELTFKQIKQQSQQNSNNIVQIALKEFQRENIIKTKTTGDVITYALNLDNNLTGIYLTIINQSHLLKQKFPKDVLAEIQKKILKQTEFFILIIFGSYAKNKAVEKSDLDIAIIVESEHIKKEITPFLETIKRREINSIDYHIFTRAEFLEMLKSDVENLGKQIHKNNLIYCGFIEYCNLIKGIKNE